MLVCNVKYKVTGEITGKVFNQHWSWDGRRLGCSLLHYPCIAMCKNARENPNLVFQRNRTFFAGSILSFGCNFLQEQDGGCPIVWERLSPRRLGMEREQLVRTNLNILEQSLFGALLQQKRNRPVINRPYDSTRHSGNFKRCFFLQLIFATSFLDHGCRGQANMQTRTMGSGPISNFFTPDSECSQVSSGVPKPWPTFCAICWDPQYFLVEEGGISDCPTS